MTPNPSPPSDDFYIGYEDAVPARIRARVRLASVALGAAGLVAVALTLAFHRRLETSRFDYGRLQPVSGALARTPYPSVRTPTERLWLAGRGKHGAEAALAGRVDGPATVDGTRIERGAHAMLEVGPGSVREAASPGAPPPSPDVNRREGVDVTLTGEIVDSKCFLGVMNPGEQTVHRDCARLCLRGGLPPMLLVRGGMGEEALVLLVSRAGQPMGPALAAIAGVPVHVRGRLHRDGDTLTLAADRDAFVLAAR